MEHNMHKGKYDKYVLFERLNQNENKDLNTFLKVNKMTPDELIEAVCDEELLKIKHIFGPNVSTLTLKQLSVLDGYSKSHLGKLRRDGELAIHSVQKGEKGRIGFPIYNVAIYLFLKAHPVQPNKYTFSNLLSEI